MKKFLFILCIMLSSISFAQSQIVSLTTYDRSSDYVDYIYIKDIDGLLNPYVGTWTWTNGNDTLTIVFQKKIFQYFTLGKHKYYRDDLVAQYKYTQGSTVIVNTFNNADTHIEISGLRPRSATKAEFLFKDFLKNKRGDIKTELITNLGTPQLKFVLKNTSGGKIVFPGEPDFDWSFSIPTNVTLTKIN